MCLHMTARCRCATRPGHHDMQCTRAPALAVKLSSAPSPWQSCHYVQSTKSAADRSSAQALHPSSPLMEHGPCMQDSRGLPTWDPEEDSFLRNVHLFVLHQQILRALDERICTSIMTNLTAATESAICGLQAAPTTQTDRVDVSWHDMQ